VVQTFKIYISEAFGLQKKASTLHIILAVLVLDAGGQERDK
jgi:hypothetical protein